MKQIKYVVYQEGNYFVSQCFNVDVSSFRDTIDDAIRSLKEAVENFITGHRRNLDEIDVLFSPEQWKNFRFIEGM